jgi:transcriptional regulator with XRE-family HTH domain
MKIGAGIRARREARKLTQRQLAARAKLSRLTVIRLERDEFSPNLDTLARIAAALRVQVRSLIPKS